LRRGDNVQVGHRFGGGVELGADALFGTAAFAHVAIDAAVEADLVWSVDVDAEVEERAQAGVVEGEDAFDDEDGEEATVSVRSRTRVWVVKS
jgi:hypothetical protein